MFWRFSKNYLPTKVNLYNMRFAITTTCSLCAVDLETTDHIMFCFFSTNILSQLGIIVILPSLEQSWIMWLSNLFDQFDEKKRVLLVVSVWTIWSYRNNKLHNQAFQTVMDLVRFIRSFVWELISIAEKVFPNSSALCPCWSPPSGDTIKINFDASFIAQLHFSFSRVVARNAEGLIMPAGIIPDHFVANPELAQAYACVDALNLA
ncbi:hypothetical protein V6N13_060225 [Hibiscus sabdariffa]